MANEKGVDDAIRVLEAAVGDSHHGLPQPVFLFTSRLTPLVNVDLLVRDERGRTLLTWRDDGYWAPGWHVPGGIIRFKETFVERLHAVAQTELGADAAFDAAPLAIHEFIQPVRRDRGHFISLAFRCRLLSPPAPALRHGRGAPRVGQWRWHEHCPDDLLAIHAVYRPYLWDGGEDR